MKTYFKTYFETRRLHCRPMEEGEYEIRVIVDGESVPEGNHCPGSNNGCHRLVVS